MTFFHILGIIGGDDILACHGEVYDGLSVWEEVIEPPVEDPGGDEGIDIADGETAQVEIRKRGLRLASLRTSCLQQREELATAVKSALGRAGKGTDLQVLTPRRHASLASTRNDNVVDEAGKRRNTADEKGDYGAPIAAEFGRVAVHAMEIVHVGNRNLPASDDVVAVAEDKRVSGVNLRSGACVRNGKRTRS